MKSTTANDLATRIKRLVGDDDTLAMSSNELYGANRFDDPLVLDAMNQAIKTYSKATERTRSEIVYAIDANGESRLPFDNMGIKQAVVTLDDPYVFGFEADYMVLTYAFTDGSDLETRTKIVDPADSMETLSFGWLANDYLGWARGYSTRMVGSTMDSMTWGGDNKGAGFESVFVDLARIKIERPSALAIKLDCRCFWYATPGVNPVTLGIILYKGGSVLSDGYGFTNPTATDSKSLTFTLNVVTSNSQESSQDGERICVLNYDLLTGTGFVDVNNNTVY